MSTTVETVPSIFKQCDGGCGKLVAHTDYCTSCKKLAAEYEAKEPKSTGQQIASASGVIGVAAIFFLVGIGILAIAGKWMGHG